MTPDAPRESPRPANKEVLKVQDEQEGSVMEVCRRVAKMGRACIKEGLFEDGSLKLALVQGMIS